MVDAHVTCKDCQNEFKIDLTFHTQRFACPNCGRSWTRKEVYALGEEYQAEMFDEIVEEIEGASDYVARPEDEERDSESVQQDLFQRMEAIATHLAAIRSDVSRLFLLALVLLVVSIIGAVAALL
jgi:predicted RNA-binding Zn-ribbon protein involved in translation (DUF1610 family)